MNMTPEKLLCIIGEKEVMIKLLQEKVKDLQDEQQHSVASATDQHAPPPWARHTKGAETS